VSAVTISKSTSETSSETLGRLAEIFVTFQGEGPHAGKRHLFVRLAGCEVGCRFCDTPDALRGGAAFEVRRPPGGVGSEIEVFANPVRASDVAEQIERLATANAPIHAISVTGGEPLEQPEFLASLLSRLTHPVLLETAGCHPDHLARVISQVAIVSMDLKLPSVARIAPRWDEHGRFLDIALASSAETYVKVIVNPTLDRTEFVRAADLVAARSPDTLFIVQPETDRKRVVTCGFDLLFDLAAIANSRGLRDVRVLPQIHKYLAAP
jgi:7-carboxy-7-deazaguanine synthase